MQRVITQSELARARRAMAGVFGLVPTMGALHRGHLSLVSRAKDECDHVGVSIFVNPTQFGPGEDFHSYPRNLDRDLEMLDKAGADLVWTPSPESIYPPGFQTWVSVERLGAPLEGKARPGHFRGVATIVAKLFNSFLPARAYFGQKDAQQVAVIRRMTTDLDFSIEIVVCPTVREPDGLAMSSRNAYLNPAERSAATVLYRALMAAKEKFVAGARKGEALRAAMQAAIRSEPLPQEEYVSVADPDTLAELDEIQDRALFSLAVRIGRTRLIDNILVP